MGENTEHFDSQPVLHLTLPLLVVPLMLDDDGTSPTVSLALAVVGVIWYVLLWAIGLLGCFAG